MKRPWRSAAFAGVLACFATAVAAREQPLPPVVALDDRTCAEQVDLAAATPVTLRPKKATEASAALDAKAACVQPAGGAKSVYTVFSLPESPEDYLLNVTSTPFGLALFSPRLQVLDAQGKLLREVARDRFTFHGTALHTVLRIHPGERYLVVASDPATIGQQGVQITGATHASGTYVAGAGAISFYWGTEGSSGYVFAHNGKVTISVEEFPKAE